MKKVLGIFAHPDDEIIWGWPLLQDSDSEKHLIVVSDNHTGYGERAKTAFDEVCKAIGIQSYTLMKYQSEFYKLPTRHSELTLPMLVAKLTEIINEIVDKISPDVIITHNPFGEYGHGDHRLVFNVISSFIEHGNICFVDACQSNKCHLSFDKIPLAIRNAYFGRPVGSYILDETWFEKVKAIYVRHRAWSWGPPHVVPTKVRLFSL